MGPIDYRSMQSSTLANAGDGYKQQAVSNDASPMISNGFQATSDVEVRKFNAGFSNSSWAPGCGGPYRMGALPLKRSGLIGDYERERSPVCKRMRISGLDGDFFSPFPPSYVVDGYGTNMDSRDDSMVHSRRFGHIQNRSASVPRLVSSTCNDDISMLPVREEPERTPEINYDCTHPCQNGRQACSSTCHHHLENEIQRTYSNIDAMMVDTPPVDMQISDRDFRKMNTAMVDNAEKKEMMRRKFHEELRKYKQQESRCASGTYIHPCA